MPPSLNNSVGAKCPFTFDLLWGFCTPIIGRTVVAIRATDSRAKPVARALHVLASSATISFLTFPYGRLKQFFV